MKNTVIEQTDYFTLLKNVGKTGRTKYLLKMRYSVYHHNQLMEVLRSLKLLDRMTSGVIKYRTKQAALNDLTLILLNI